MMKKLLYVCGAAGSALFFVASAYQADSWPKNASHLANKHITISAVGCEIGAVADCQRVTIRVWDGDTFLLHQDSRKAIKIRIENIDAPEIDGKCAAEIDAAQRAKRRLAGLLENREIRLILDGTDRYHRQLATVMADGRDVGEVMIAEGTTRRWDGRRRPWC